MALVVVTRQLPEAALDPLRAAHDVRVYDEDFDEDGLIAVAHEADALIPILSNPITARVLDGCPKLKVVAQFAVGYDNIDLVAARERGIIVANTPGVLTEGTADLAFALLLAAARRIPEADRYVREGRFRRWETMLLLGNDLHGKTLGLVGMGRIGRAVARRALGFGMRILYHNRRPINPTDERLLSARYVAFDDLVAASDFISIHCPLNAQSHHLFTRDVFRRMKPSALLVNTARGPVVDEAALVEALHAGEIAGAALDVFEHEPAVHPGLLDHPRVVVSPHLGSSSLEVRTAMAELCVNAVLAVLSGNEDVPNRVER